MKMDFDGWKFVEETSGSVFRYRYTHCQSGIPMSCYITEMRCCDTDESFGYHASAYCVYDGVQPNVKFFNGDGDTPEAAYEKMIKQVNKNVEEVIDLLSRTVMEVS